MMLGWGSRVLFSGLSNMRMAFALLAGHLRRLRNHVRKRWAGKDPVKNSAFEAVYVHYDRYGIVHDYVLDQLRNLVGAGFRITFVTNSPEFEDRSVNDILPYCRQVLWRRNVGYDFGAYKDGIAAIGNLDRVERLVLMNDSAYGPFRPLSTVLPSIDPNKVDVWGITDSWEHRYHIQSYFILFLPNTLRTSAFQKFWKRLPYVNNKDVVIRRGEIRLTNVLARRKLRISVLCPYWSVARRVLDKLEGRRRDLPKPHADFLENLHNRVIQGLPVNGSHFFWDTLITEFNCPFLKREVITVNPAGVPYVWRWDEIVANQTAYDTALIRRHLQSV